MIPSAWNSYFDESLLNDCSKAIYLSVILGSDANILQQNGIETLGELLMVNRKRIWDLRGMGETKFNRISRLISAICDNVNDQGHVNWDSIDPKLFHKGRPLSGTVKEMTPLQPEPLKNNLNEKILSSPFLDFTLRKKATRSGKKDSVIWKTFSV